VKNTRGLSESELEPARGRLSGRVHPHASDSMLGGIVWPRWRRPDSIVFAIFARDCRDFHVSKRHSLSQVNC
jgi:hypothetical protein